jgi:hypothetical protein
MNETGSGRCPCGLCPDHKSAALAVEAACSIILIYLSVRDN